MTKKLNWGKQFKKDYKKSTKQGKDEKDFLTVLNYLLNGLDLPEKYRDHILTGNYKDCRECHIYPDWLLIYAVDETDVYLLRIGSHSELFNK